MAVQGISGGSGVPFHAIYLDLQVWLPRELIIPEPPSLLPSFDFVQEAKDSLRNGLGTWVFVSFCFSCQGYTDVGQMFSYFQEGQS